MQKLSILLGSILLTGCSLAIEPRASQGPIPAADPIVVDAPQVTTKKPNNSANKLKETPAPAIKSGKEGETYYIVKKKDTVFEIMRQTGVDWKTIIKLNDLKAPKYNIYPGQQLRIK